MRPREKRYNSHTTGHGNTHNSEEKPQIFAYSFRKPKQLLSAQLNNEKPKICTPNAEAEEVCTRRVNSRKSDGFFHNYTLIISFRTALVNQNCKAILRLSGRTNHFRKKGNSLDYFGKTWNSGPESDS